MRSVLDEAESWQLRELRFRDFALELTLIELHSEPAPTGAPPLRPQERTRLTDAISDLLKGARHLTPKPGGRIATVWFERVLTHRVTDESFTAADNADVVEGKGKLMVFTRSRFLDLFNLNGLAPAVAKGAYQHYCIWTEHQVVDVIATTAPHAVLRQGA